MNVVCSFRKLCAIRNIYLQCHLPVKRCNFLSKTVHDTIKNEIPTCRASSSCNEKSRHTYICLERIKLELSNKSLNIVKRLCAIILARREWQNLAVKEISKNMRNSEIISISKVYSIINLKLIDVLHVK